MSKFIIERQKHQNGTITTFLKWPDYEVWHHPLFSPVCSGSHVYITVVKVLLNSIRIYSKKP